MEPNKHYPAQMNGPVISAFGEGITREFDDVHAVVDYLHGLSLDTAQETELENIGRLIGYIRPLVPDGFTNEDLFIFGSLPETSDALIGFGTVGSSVGGQLSTLQTTEENKMAIGTYRQMLEKIAYIKRYGLTLATIDKIAKMVADNYTISYNTNHDIVITYQSRIGYKNLYILTQLFYRVATEPQIIVISGTTA